MSQDFMDAELFADFIVEAKEHLETIEPNLLELEKAPGNLGLLNDIFRPMHSLKGASGFLGLTRINQLAHKCENILDDLRRGSMVVTPEIMDVILASTDALRQMIDKLETTSSDVGVEIVHLIEQIDAIMAGESAPPALQQQDTITEVELTSQYEEQPDTDPGAPTSTPQNNMSLEKMNLSPKEWYSTLPVHEGYTLTAFGESHLNDFIDESLEIVESLNTEIGRAPGR